MKFHLLRTAFLLCALVLASACAIARPLAPPDAETDPVSTITASVDALTASLADPVLVKSAEWRPASATGSDTALAMRIIIGLSLLTILPALLVSLTAFLRIIIVLSMLRHAIGMQETPPNTVLIGLALFLTLFTMSPVLKQIDETAFSPFMQGKMPMQTAYEKGVQPLREFMIRQTREQDLALMIELAKAPSPKNMADISNVQLVPAFMLSELRAAFQIGFVIFLPFLLIDLIVSSILMGLGMMMMPPVSISLPVKILLFILIDGWSLILKALVGSFH